MQIKHTERFPSVSQQEIADYNHGCQRSHYYSNIGYQTGPRYGQQLATARKESRRRWEIVANAKAEQ